MRIATLPLAALALLAVTACEHEQQPTGPTEEQLRQEATGVMAAWSRAIAAGDFRTACTAWTSRGSQNLVSWCLQQAGAMSSNDAGWVISLHRGAFVRSIGLDDDCHAHTKYQTCASAYVTSTQLGNGQTTRYVLVREFDGWKLANPSFHVGTA